MAEQMKPSGIDWIKDIPSSWEINKVKYLATEPGTLFLDGDWIESDVIEESGIRYLTTGNVGAGFYKEQGSGYISEKTFSELHCLNVYPGDLMISRLNEPIGRSCIIPDTESRYVVAVDNVILRPNANYNKKFIMYGMNADGYAEHANMIARGATMSRISRSQLGQFWLAFPNIEEQQAIADFLDKECTQIDSIAADLERQIALLQQYKKSLITETVTKGLDKSVPMKDTGVEWIGEIPVGWELSRIKYLTDNHHPYPIGDGDHGMIKADDYLTEGIPYIRVLNLTWGSGLNLENLVFISKEMNSLIKNSELKPNDILIAKTGATIGKTAIVPDSLPVSNTTSHVGKITLANVHDAKYFYYVMTSSIVQKQIQDISAMQSTRPELGIEGLKNLILTVPPFDIQQHIARFLDDHCAKIDRVLHEKGKQLSVIKQHKKSLIYEYVTGKKRVKEVR